MTQETSRPVVASWYRKGRLITVRHYVRLDTSIPTITRNLILDGHVDRHDEAAPAQRCSIPRKFLGLGQVISSAPFGAPLTEDI